MIVIPMVGLSRRFFDAGHALPKHQLRLDGVSVFAHAVASFRHYFDSESFRFLVRADHDTPAFVAAELAALGVRDARVDVFHADTRGQAETVHLGLADVAPGTPIWIFNIDTFRPGFRKPAALAGCDGYLEVFRGEGEHWSFVDAAPDGRVRRTTEKERISDLCSDGLYYFREKRLFDEAFAAAVAARDTVNGEFYVAPLYNRLIGAGLDIRYHLIGRDEVVFCGTPDDYRQLQRAAFTA